MSAARSAPALQVNYQAQFQPAGGDRAHDRAQRPARGRRSGDPAEAGAVLRRNRSHAAESDARLQPDQSKRACPGPEGSIQKIFWSELNQRFQQVADGDSGTLRPAGHGRADAFDDGQWAYGYLRSRGNTIEAGTSEIQRNHSSRAISCSGLPRAIRSGMDITCNSD